MDGGILAAVKMIVLDKLQNLKENISVATTIRTIPCRRKGPTFFGTDNTYTYLNVLSA